MQYTIRRLSSIRISDECFAKFTSILSQCGLRGKETPRGNVMKLGQDASLSKDTLLTDQRFQAFQPLFTHEFHFGNQQLTTLGDTIIDDYLSDMILDFCAHRGIVLTQNAAKQLNAVFHNHFTLQLLASDLGLAELALPLSSVRNTTGGSALDYLEAHRTGVGRRDVAGTSFHMTPLSCGQSPLGWKLSHFIGAVHCSFGAEAALQCVDGLYHLLNTEDVPNAASKLLLRVLERFPAASVAEAILAAQGMPMCFVGKTRIVGPVVTDDAGTPESTSTPSGEQTDVRGDPLRHDMVLVLSGFNPRSMERAESLQPELTLDELTKVVASGQYSRSLAHGPDFAEYGARWKARTAELVAVQAEPPLEEAIDGDGWLSPEDQKRSQRGPAFTHAVDVSAGMTFADTYGMPEPVNGKTVSRRKFKKPVRDPLFYDKMSDMRNGVPLSTNGEPLHDFLDDFAQPHRRLFEVTMMTPHSQGRVIGRAIASRYTIARDSASKAFLGGVLRDLAAVPLSRDTEQQTEGI